MAVNMFITFLNMSISGTLTAVLLILWRYVTYKYIPSKFYYTLWLVLVCRLIIPFHFKSVFSILNLFKRASDYSFGSQYVVTMEYLSYSGSTDASADSTPLFAAVASAVWFAVALFCIGRWLYVAYVTNRHLRYAVLCTDAAAKQLKADVGLRRAVKIYTSPRVVSPVVTGFFRPRVVLPLREDPLGGSQRYAVAHELVHIKRCDYILKALFYFTAALHWYNPLVWYCFGLFNDDIEISCDQQVLHIYGAEHRSMYACALYEHARRKNIFRLEQLAFAANSVSERIEKALAYKKTSTFKIVLFTAATLLIGLCSTTNPILSAKYAYTPKTVYVNSAVRRQITDFAEAFAADIEANNVEGIMRRSTADTAQLAPVYNIFEHCRLAFAVEKIFYTSPTSADVFLTLTENDGTIFAAGTPRAVVQIGSSRVMGGLYAETLHSYDKYSRIHGIDHSDEAVMLVDKLIRFGLTDGSDTPQNAEKIAAFCAEIAYERGKDKERDHIPQKEVEAVANEFFFICDPTNLRGTGHYSQSTQAYLYNKSIGTQYEYQIVSFEKAKNEAIITVEFYKDPLQTQVEYTVNYTLRRV